MHADSPDDLGLTERRASAAEMAAILGVTEDDVLEWMLAGHIPFEEGADGEPRVVIREAHERDGPLATSIMQYSISRDPAFQAELGRRRRQLERTGLDTGGVDVAALARALGERLAAVAPPQVRIEVNVDMIDVLDVRGGGAGIDVAAAAEFPRDGADPERVRSACQTTLEQAQDEFAEVTTDPWPHRGPGALPEPHAELAAGDVRLYYGDAADPVLELAPLALADVTA